MTLSERVAMKKILYTTCILEYVAAGGPFLRVENSIKALSNIAELHIISRVPKDHIGGELAEKFYKNYCARFLYAPSVDPLVKTGWIDKILTRLKLLFSNGNKHKKNQIIKRAESRRDAAFIVKYAHLHGIDVIWFGYGSRGAAYYVMREVSKLDPKLRIICCTDSVQSTFLFRGAEIIKSREKKDEVIIEAKQKAQEEREWVSLCDVTTAVSAYDAVQYQSLTNNSNKIKLFSNVIDIQNYKKSVVVPENFKRPCIYLAGYFGPHSPMYYAAQWLIDEVVPLVKKTIPDVHVYVVGNGAELTLENINDDSIEIKGWVESVLPYLKNADVAVVPLHYESGTRFKILEAAACGIPIVSTTLGAEGLDVVHEKNILIADSPAKFAYSIVKLIKDKDLSRTIAQNCRELIQQNYSLKRLEKEGKDILDYLDKAKENSGQKLS